MRTIGTLSDEARARFFGDFLLGRKIRNEIESDGGGGWMIWVLDEERVAEAQGLLEKFLANPDALEFRDAQREAARVRAEEKQELADYQRRVRTRRSLFPRFGGYGVGPLTYGLIFLCVIVAVYSKLGSDLEFVRRLLLADPENANGRFLPEVSAGEVWRLLTPMLIHFGILHLLFNMMWLYQLGCMIEARLGSLTLAALVLVTAAIPFIAQYVAIGPGYVGGMSGVVYGLAGFVWMRGKHDRASGVGLDWRSIEWLLIWLVICFTGWLGPVANAAHVAGLVVGMIWGRVSAYIATR